ncbi:MAG: SDR family NAD(P)-dependent oxidoreductase [Bacteroidales bacterium]|nr:SDR family NAD(P)-dependent oxidoreductase [Bacteroidales bacterium]
MSTVWITGASSGIGEAVAYAYAAKGDRLILTSSSRERLEPVASQCLEKGAADVRVLACDLRDPEAIPTLVKSAWSAFGPIDTAILNAGISQRTTVEDTSMVMVREIMEVNFFAPVAIGGALAPLMAAEGGGRIAVTTSIAGKFGFPLRCGYSSSKFALYGYFETLRAEYHDKGISVTFICPGRVRTNISVNALDKGGRRHGELDPGQAGGLEPVVAARRIEKAVRLRKSEVLVGGKELLMVHIKRFLPGLCSRLARKVSAV